MYRFCVDCKYSKIKKVGLLRPLQTYICTHPLATGISLVTGKALRKDGFSCSDMRLMYNTDCGILGKLFEPIKGVESDANV